MSYVSENDLQDYGITNPQALDLVEAASMIIDAHTRWPMNPDGAKFPRFADGALGVTGDFSGSATLAANITNSATSFAVSGSLVTYPSGTDQNFWLKIDSEYMHATALSAGTVTVDERGAFDTEAVAHSAGAVVQFAVIPEGVKFAVMEEILWILQNGGMKFLRQGGYNATSSTVEGKSETRPRAQSPLLGPMAQLYLRPFIVKTGYAGWL